MELPGASAPLLTTTDPVVPVPFNVPPLTVNVELDITPLTASVPLATVHGIAMLLLPARVQVESSTLANALKLRYCCAGPIRLTSTEPLPDPPSRNASLPVPSTLPMITLVGARVRTLLLP